MDGGFDVGLKTLIGGESVLTLGACATDGLWMDALSSQSFFASCAENRRIQLTVKHAETVAARALGFRFVLTDSDPTSEDRDKYYRLLKQLCTTTLTHIDALSDLSLMVVLEGDSFGSDKRNGVLSVPLSATPGEIISYIHENGPTFARSYRNYIRERQFEDRLQLSLRRSLRVKQVTRANHLSNAKFSSACRRLLHDADVLRPYMEGLEVEIGTECKLEERNGRVTIPYDFTIPKRKQR